MMTFAPGNLEVCRMSLETAADMIASENTDVRALDAHTNLHIERQNSGRMMLELKDLGAYISLSVRTNAIN